MINPWSHQDFKPHYSTCFYFIYALLYNYFFYFYFFLFYFETIRAKKISMILFFCIYFHILRYHCSWEIKFITICFTFLLYIIIMYVFIFSNVFFHTCYFYSFSLSCTYRWMNFFHATFSAITLWCFYNNAKRIKKKT